MNTSQVPASPKFADEFKKLIASLKNHLKEHYTPEDYVTVTPAIKEALKTQIIPISNIPSPPPLPQPKEEIQLPPPPTSTKEKAFIF